MMSSVKEVCEKIWAIERALSLFEKDVCGVRIWPLVRMIVYYRICQAVGLFSTPHSERVPIGNVIRAIGNVLRAPFTSPFFNASKKKFLVFDHPRKVPVEGDYVDIYTKSLLESLPQSETEALENWDFGRHLTKKQKGRSYLDDLSAGSSLARLFPLSFSRQDAAFISKLEQKIVEEFGISIPLARLFKSEIHHHRYSLKYYTRLFKKLRPKRVYMVVSYSHYKRAFICAAKRLGIETVEMQHGTFSPYHLGYNFPDTTCKIEPFPDRFYSFGDYWNGLAKMPIPKERIKTFGYQHFHDRVKKVEQEAKIKGFILFISQGVIGKRLSVVAQELAKLLPSHRIIYKLHPGERTLWKTDYEELVEAATLPNFEVVDSNLTDLYTYFARCEYLVGVFSTAIYEGLGLGCRTFVVNLPGVEYMDYLVQNNIVAKVDSAQDIANSIMSNNPPAAVDNNFIFAKVE